jgi:hypothetical protein
MFKPEDIALVLQEYFKPVLRKKYGIKMLGYVADESSVGEITRYSGYSRMYHITFEIKHTVLRDKLFEELLDNLNETLIKPLDLTYYDKWLKTDSHRDDFCVNGVEFLNKNKERAFGRSNIHYIKFRAVFMNYDDSTVEIDFKHAIREIKMSQLRI